MTATTIWTDFARSYDRVLANWDPYLELVELASRHLEGCRDILDLGCGTGIVSERLASRGARVEGIDSNPAMLAVARSRLFEARDRFTPRLGDALALPYADASFDGVVANNVIFYVSDPRRMLEEICRVLRSGGILAMSGPRPDPDLALLQRKTLEEFACKGISNEMRAELDHFLACSRALKRSGMPNVYELPEISALLEEVGFEEAIERRDALYYGQTWFVAARKSPSTRGDDWSSR